MKKTVKAWAVVDRKSGKLMQHYKAIDSRQMVYSSRKEAMTDCSESLGETILPCTITYDLPKKVAKK